jgi:hypothetical protein
VVVDGFESKSVDVNGDGTPDISHGEFASRIAERTAAQAKRTVSVDRVEIDKKTNGSRDFESTFNKLTQRLKSGERIDSVSLSQSLKLPVFDAQGKQTGGVDPSVERVSQALYPNDAKKQAAFAKAAKSQAGLSSAQKAEVRQLFEKYYGGSLGAYKTMVSEAEKRGTRVFVAAGNEPGQINPFSLYEPTITVGATSAQGVQAKWSSRVGTTDTFAPGEMNLKRVNGGVAVNSDITPLVSDAELSKGTHRLAGVIGQPYRQVKASAKDYQAVVDFFSNVNNVYSGTAPNVGNKVFDASRLGSMLSASARASQNPFVANGMDFGTLIQARAATAGGYVTFVSDPSIQLNPQTVAVRNNKVVLDATRGNGQGVLSITQGTSWAAPAAATQAALKASGQ